MNRQFWELFVPTFVILLALGKASGLFADLWVPRVSDRWLRAHRADNKIPYGRSAK